MKYNFDLVNDRRNTNAIKWDHMERFYEPSDVLPMWVADMEFVSPVPVIEALKKRVDHGVFGYADVTESYLNAVVAWMKERHNWEVEKEWLKVAPGVMPAICWLIEGLTRPGDKVLIQRPVYNPFFASVENNGRHAVNSPLIIENDRYVMDYADLEEKARDPRVKLLLLCNPHNPVGRVWEKEELMRLGDICINHGVTVISDEIHADLVYNGYKHTPYASISEEFAQNSIVCTAPSKTFNIAGLQTANIIIKNQELRMEFDKVLQRNCLGDPNLLGAEACEAAYRYGWDWLNQVLEYLEGNLLFLADFLKEKIPQIDMIKPEGTYLAWLDCKKLGMNSNELEEFMNKKAKVILSQGRFFGEEEGEGFVRMNFACPRSMLEKAMIRIEDAVKGI